MTPAELEPDLRKPFALDAWRELLPSLLPGLSLFIELHDIPIQSETERAVAKSLKQFGTARLADGKSIGLFLIEAKPGVDLARNRVGLRQLAARWIDQVELHAALAFSYQPDAGFYRLTFAARESVFTPDLQLATRETATRRFTYVLGEGERRRTAAQRLSILADRRPELTLADVIDAFSVEKLNREFFADFCRARASLTEEIHTRGKLQEDHARSEAQTILNRLLFLSFLQRKGWLNRQRDYIAAAFHRLEASDPEGSDFYAKFLVPVFGIVSTEWKQREKITTHLDENNPHRHDLPFLNGGLFSDELASLDDNVRRRRELKIGNAVFHHVFTNLFERYNFTIHEDSERDAEVAVDPEMLGRIFEELVLTAEDSESGGKSRRHDTGSHYTPRPIVRYNCREALAAWLADQAPFTSKPDPRACVDALLALDGSVGIDDDTWAKLRELLTPSEAATALDALFELRSCDPAVGSGAFPLGLLHELLNAARLLDARARGKDPGETDPDWLYDNKKRLVERCIYGTDIQEEALEICKLRLWLSLMVDHQLGVDPDECDRRAFATALKKVEPLPNLEFKIRRANALVDTIRGQRLRIERPQQDKSILLVLDRLREAKHDFYTADTAAKKRRFRFGIYLATAELAQHQLSWMKRELGLGLDDSPEILARIAHLDLLEHALGELRRQLDAAKKLKATFQEDALERLRTWWEDPKAPTFVWQFDFAEVFHRSQRTAPRGELLEEQTTVSLAGFDLMIGNPPYIRLQVLKRSAPEDVDWYREHYAAAKKGNYDLYVVFIERALRLLHDHGQLAFIVPHKFFNAQYGEPLRELIATGRYLRHVVHFGDQQIFPGATNYVCLLFLSRGGAANCRFVRADVLRIWLAAQQGIEGEIPRTKITPAEWNFSVGKNSGLFERIGNAGEMLGEMADAFVGLQTSADDVFILELVSEESRTIRLKSRVLDREVVLEKAMLHPLVSGEDVKGFAPLPRRQFIIFPYDVSHERATLIPFDRLCERYHRLGNYLLENRERLEQRESGRMACDDWHGYIYMKNMLRQGLPKVCVPRLVSRLHAGIDIDGTHYLDNVDVGGVTWKTEHKDFGLQYLAALLNSRVIGWFFPQVSAPFRGGFFSANRQFLSLLPIPAPTPDVQNSITGLVDWLLFLNRQPSVRAATSDHPRDPQMAAWFERWVNALVYELFFPEELRAKGLSFLPLTEDFAPSSPAADADAAATLADMRKTVDDLSAPGHALRRALDQLQTLDLVRTIEGSA
ncbi:MAG: Eco57I restriction-modification methylase domain-containing protein [Verrucomicrobia bacterium]|nr:Eco57I restriction-modification methylase domain-containing protein [Verrucomicrobiota bacterium]